METQNKQPKALMLADYIEIGGDYPPTLSNAAAELRRLQALNGELEAAVFSALAIFNWLERRSLYQDFGMKAAHNQLRNALSKAKE